MFSRIRSAMGPALLLALVTSVTVFAKGGFSFIAITGPGLKEEVRATHTGLTEDFFAFADFYRDKVEAPANPGQGYEIRRYYVDGNSEIAFDQLHYYPETGYVFYDGIVNGDSEYDGEWYAANPIVKPLFESVLPAAMSGKADSVQPSKSVQPGVPVTRSNPSPSIAASQAILPVAVLGGAMVLALFALRLRKPSTQ